MLVASGSYTLPLGLPRLQGGPCQACGLCPGARPTIQGSREAPARHLVGKERE